MTGSSATNLHRISSSTACETSADIGASSLQTFLCIAVVALWMCCAHSWIRSETGDRERARERKREREEGGERERNTER